MKHSWLIPLALLLMIIFILAEKIPINGCWAEDAELSAGTWGGSCDNTYPGPALSADDELYEVHQVRKQGSGFWAGLKINSTNATLECFSVDKVDFCYKWWSETDEVQNCDISVDADDMSSFTVITSACPGTSEPDNITCIDVISLENWTCENFLSAGAYAKSELVHTGQDDNGYFNITWDVFFFNVTYNSEDNIPPVFSNLMNKSIYYDEALAYDIDATDPSNISCFSVDNANFTINCTGFLTNATGLEVKKYTVNISVNDSYGNSESGIITIEVKNYSVDFNIEEVPIEVCAAEDAAASSGTWSNSCDYSYPGDYLFQDDSLYEVHQVMKDGSGFWAGLRINSTDSANDCGSIDKVFFCYKWWSETDTIENCDISVDADSGSSFSSITTQCPGTAEPAKATCIDITSVEAWTCDNFFGKGVFAKSELVHNQDGGNGYFNVTWDVFYFNVTYTNETYIVISNLLPEEAAAANITDTIEISLEVSSYYQIDSVYAVVTDPESETYRIELENISGSFTAVFQIPEIIGEYEITVYANDTLGHIQSAGTYFNADDQTAPSISSAFISKSMLYTAQKNKLSMEADDNIEIDSCWLDITLPDMSTDVIDISCSGVELHYDNTVQIGTYNVVFYANDTSGNVAYVSDSFQILSKVDLTLDLELISSLDSINITVYNGDEIIYSNLSNEDNTFSLPESVFDFEFIAFDNRLKAKLRSINASQNTDRIFGMDRHTEDSDSLVTYSIRNTYDFTNATLVIDYSDISEESTLQLFKCDDYNLTERECISGWYDITSSATQSGNKFELLTSGFSGFKIKEYSAAVVQSSGGRSIIKKTIINETFHWNCLNWSNCIGGVQYRECTKYDSKGSNISTQIIDRICLVTENISIERTTFDTTLIIDDKLNIDEGVLNAVILVENFLQEPIIVNINFTIIDMNNKSIFNDQSDVYIDKILWKEFSSTYIMRPGNYTITLDVVYNSTIQHIEKTVNIIADKSFFGRQGKVFSNQKFLTLILGAICLIIISASYLYFNWERFSTRFRK